MAAARVAVLRVGQGLESRESLFFDDIIFKSPKLFLGFSGDVSFKNPKLWGTCVYVSSLRDVRGDRRIPSLSDTGGVVCTEHTGRGGVLGARRGSGELGPAMAARSGDRVVARVLRPCFTGVGGGAPTGTSLAASKLAKM